MQYWGVKPDGVIGNAAAIAKATQYAIINKIILVAPADNINTSKWVLFVTIWGFVDWGR
jgi:hypothetical protein